jgi:predicted DsbA family dithiol-disulfide isomerase
VKAPPESTVDGDLVVDLVVDLFVDVVCPWCLVGNERLERVLAARGPGEPPVAVRYHPFLLDPDTPPGGRVIPTMLRQRYGVDPRQLWARVEAEARKADVELDLSKQPRAVPTIRAHTLVRHAAERGTTRTLVRALFRAYFLDARNIDDPGVLAEIASHHGFSAAEASRLVTDEAELAITDREAQQAVAAGITGVPFYVVGGRFAISGAQPEEVLRSALERAAAEAPTGVA